VSIEKLKNLKGLVDFDEVVYRLGFTVKEGEPLEHSLHNVKKVLVDIWEKFDDDAQGYLSGSDNFRMKVAVTKGYKENRKDARKPPHYQEIKEYMREYWSGIVVEGREADDAIGEAQSLAESNTTCIVGQDKDFKTIPGWHYNPVKQKVFYTTDEQASLFFLYQLMTGDRVDNIPGIPGCGEKTAQRVIKDCGRSIDRIKREIKGMYKKSYGQRAEEVLHEQATLLFIHREPGKTYLDYIGGF
jgi:hypothetical protein